MEKINDIISSKMPSLFEGVRALTTQEHYSAETTAAINAYADRINGLKSDIRQFNIDRNTLVDLAIAGDTSAIDTLLGYQSKKLALILEIAAAVESKQAAFVLMTADEEKYGYEQLEIADKKHAEIKDVVEKLGLEKSSEVLSKALTADLSYQTAKRASAKALGSTPGFSPAEKGLITSLREYVRQQLAE